MKRREEISRKSEQTQSKNAFFLKQNNEQDKRAIQRECSLIQFLYPNTPPAADTPRRNNTFFKNFQNSFHTNILKINQWREILFLHFLRTNCLISLAIIHLDLSLVLSQVSHDLRRSIIIIIIVMNIRENNRDGRKRILTWRQEPWLTQFLAGPHCHCPLMAGSHPPRTRRSIHCTQQCRTIRSTIRPIEGNCHSPKLHRMLRVWKEEIELDGISTDRVERRAYWH